MRSNREKEPLWPTVPSRITVEDPPLLAQVSELMEHAKPMQTLRHSCIRDRVIADVARKKTTQREQERNISRKRGRRSGTANNELEQVYLPAGVASNGMGLGEGSSRERLCNGGKRQGPVWNGSANIDRSESTSRRSDVGNIGRSRRGKIDGLRLSGCLPTTRSEQTISTLQPQLPSSGLPFASHWAHSLDLGDNGLSFPSWNTRACQLERHHRQQRGHRLAVPSPSTRRMPAVAMAATNTNTVGDRGTGSHHSDSSPSAPLPVALSLSSPDIDSSRPLTGVCYITYPPTPDLTAVVGAASPGLPLKRSLYSGNSGSGTDKGIMAITRERTDGPPVGLTQRQKETAGAAAEGALTSGSSAADLTSPGAQDRSCGYRVDGGGLGVERQRGDFEEPSSIAGSHGCTSTSAKDPSGTSPCLAHCAEPDDSKQRQQRHLQQQNPRADDQSGVGKVGHRLSVSMGGEGAVGGRAGRKARRRRQRRKGRGRQRLILGKNSSRLTMKTASTVNLLGGSRVSPTLPGVDEHQRPVFWLAEMHESLRKNRTRMDTEIETELSMVVRYFMRFGAKEGRDGLTLQDLEAAFRASRRADAFLAIEKKGKAAFAKCLVMFEAHGLTPEAWLEELLSKRKGDSLTTFDMGESIRAYNRAKPSWVRSHKHWLHGFMISEKDLRWCQRFVDPDGNTDVDAEEFFNAVRSTLDGKPRISFEESR
ncbi:unnamed protein product [Hapterophycus canaliculatus]